jgi:glutaredoxin
MDTTKHSPPNTLFSSNTCKYCRMFMNTLNTSMMMDQFNIVDIHKTAFDVSTVKVVPTIVVNNNRALSGRDAFAWLQNEIKNMVSGVESFGTSSVFTYIDDDRAEYSLSTQYVNIDDAPSASSEKHENDSDNSRGSDLDDAMERLKAQRNAALS